MEPLAAMGADQVADEAVRHGVGEALLAIEAAITRVECALTEVPPDAETWVHISNALKAARVGLDGTRRQLQQDAYFPSPQRHLF
ncbi:MAG: hypothetical protein ACYDGN_12410 [Acidimicrobiales bacterium]